MATGDTTDHERIVIDALKSKGLDFLYDQLVKVNVAWEFLVDAISELEKEALEFEFEPEPVRVRGFDPYRRRQLFRRR